MWTLNKDYEKVLRDDYMFISNSGKLELHIGKDVCSDCIDIAYSGYHVNKLDIENIALALRNWARNMKDGIYCLSVVNVENGEPQASAFLHLENGRFIRLFDEYGTHQKVMWILSIYKYL